MASATTRSGHPARVRWVEVFERKEAAWTATRLRATSTSSSDRRPNAEPVGEWDWEPPLGTTVPTASSAHEPEEPETADEADSEASDDEDDEEDD